MTFAYARVIAAVVLASAAGVLPSHADEYPSRPVKIIVPFGAGGPTDIYARDIAAELQNSLHEPFVMENRPGAGTTIGTDFAAKATPDGYTLLMVSGTQTVNETLYYAEALCVDARPRADRAADRHRPRAGRKPMRCRQRTSPSSSRWRGPSPER